MVVNDPLSDVVTRVRNGYAAGKAEVEMPWTRAVEAVMEVLAKYKFVGKLKKQDRTLTVELVYKGKAPAVVGISRVSKPGVRIYSGVKSLPRVLGGLGMNILSTPKGVMSDKEAKKLHVGGEILVQVW